MLKSVFFCFCSLYALFIYKQHSAGFDPREIAKVALINFDEVQ